MFVFLRIIPTFLQPLSLEGFTKHFLVFGKLDEWFPSEDVGATWTHVYGVFAGINTERADTHEAAYEPGSGSDLVIHTRLYHLFAVRTVYLDGVTIKPYVLDHHDGSSSGRVCAWRRVLLLLAWWRVCSRRRGSRRRGAGVLTVGGRRCLHSSN